MPRRFYLVNWAKSFELGGAFEALRVDLNVLSVVAKVGVILQVGKSGREGKGALALLGFFIGGKHTNVSSVRLPGHIGKVVEDKVLGRRTGSDETSSDDSLIGVLLARVGRVGDVLVSHEEDILEVNGLAICLRRCFDIGLTIGCERYDV